MNLEDPSQLKCDLVEDLDPAWRMNGNGDIFLDEKIQFRLYQGAENQDGNRDSRSSEIQSLPRCSDTENVDVLFGEFFRDSDRTRRSYYFAGSPRYDAASVATSCPPYIVAKSNVSNSMPPTAAQPGSGTCRWLLWRCTRRWPRPRVRAVPVGIGFDHCENFLVR